MDPVIIVHPHEITLKGNNRPFFERQFLQNIRRILQDDLSRAAVKGSYGRYVIRLGEGPRTERISDRLLSVFGVANICIGFEVEQNIDKLCEAAFKSLEPLKFKTIRVHTTRADKTFKPDSMSVNKIVGGYLCGRFGIGVNLSEPDITVYIEIADGTAFVYSSKLKGLGGLPSGVSGKVVTLLSAGFDSPVASWLIMKRGAVNIFMHCHSMPYTSSRSVDQVRQIIEVLTKYQLSSKFFLVPFADVQNEIVLNTPQHLRVILYRRFMMRIAEDVARRERAEAIVTGESVGQVASQTLRNIRNIENAVGLPVLRPLSGSDKEEIIVLARKIGTHDISMEPYDDCCSYLAPRKPETWSNLSEIQESESKLDISRMLQSVTMKISVENYTYPRKNEEPLL